MNASIATVRMESQRGGPVIPASSSGTFPDEDCGVRAASLAGSVAGSLQSTRQNLRTVRSLKLAGPAGQLEAVLNQGSSDARFAALVCHPHPLGGGNLHNKVVYRMMKVLNDSAWGLGCAVLRFNFRGTGLSEGAHDGQAESGDVEAAMDWLEHEFRLPLIVAGFSFGAVMAMCACGQRVPEQRNVRALVALGLPVAASGRVYEYSSLEDLAVPKLFLSGDRDPFAPIEQLTEVVASAAEPKRLIFISGADHFFTGQLESMQRALSGWLKEQLP